MSVFRQFLKKASGETYILAFMISGAISAGTFVGVRKLMYDPDIQLRRSELKKDIIISSP